MLSLSLSLLVVFSPLHGICRYHSPSHAAEITAGYYNTNYQDAYYNIAQTFARHNVDFDFTCLELFGGQCLPCVYFCFSSL